jgi:hypothetical protein
LDLLFGVQVPYVSKLIITGGEVGGSWRKLAVPDPVVVLLQGVLESAIDGGPDLNEFIVAT